MENAKEIVRPFYTQCLTVQPGGDPAALMDRLLADGFLSHGSADQKSKATLIGQIQFFWKLVPDLKWEIQDMIQEGDRVVVRSIASGTPSGDFMGVPIDGKRAFRIMTIDIHTVEGGRIREVHHLEDWGTAMKQLKS